jgi:hypothetical protein
MKGKPGTGSQTFAEDFLLRLHAIFNYLQAREIKELRRDGVLFFKQKYTYICLYNVCPDGVQIIFNRNLLSNQFEAAHDYAASAPVDWELIMAIILDILGKNDGEESGDKSLRFKNNLSRSNRIPKNRVKDPVLLQVNRS